MFVSEKAIGEVTVRKASSWMREGLERFGDVGRGASWDRCAIGVAFRAKTGFPLEGLHNTVLKASQVLDIPSSLVHFISVNHFSGTMTTKECADYLERVGY